MKRVVFGAGLVFTALLAVRAYGYSYSPPHYTQYGSGTSEHCYVFVQRTGLDVECTVLANMEDAKPEIEKIQQANVESAKANKAVRDEVAKLENDLASKKRALARAKDDSAKADARKAVDDLNARIREEKSQIRPLTVWAWPMAQFNKRADADRYIEEIRRAAEAEREKAAREKASGDTSK